MAGRGSPLHRLLGLETEYAIRFSPEHELPPQDPPELGLPQQDAEGISEISSDDSFYPHPRFKADSVFRAAPRLADELDGNLPGNDLIFQAIRDALGQVVATRPGSSAPGRDQLFVENGGAFYYEYLPHCLWGGLVEGATPECRGPGQVVLYQRAQEALLREALPLAEKTLRAEGFAGQLGLLKNSRDASGHTYGSQENYEATLAEGLPLWLYRCGVALILPILAVQTVLTYLLVLLILIGALLVTIAMLFVPPWRRKLERLSDDQRQLEMGLGRFQLYFTLIVTWPITALFARLLELFAFRRIRTQMLAFLVTRSILVGSGSVDDDRHFRLGEKAQSIRLKIRRTILPEDRPIFDTGNLIKMLASPFNLQLAPVTRLFRKKQRLQLNLADSNRAQAAEFLKVGTASLLLDMIEDGFLKDAPRLVRPIEALHALNDDPTLAVRLEVRGGPPRTALEIQRYYLERAREYLRTSKATSMEAQEVIRLWSETLSSLEKDDMGALVGRLDWVTKRFLLERAVVDEDIATLKTVDLRYHELGEGYYDRLEKAGQTARLIDPDAVRQAMREPPRDTPAFFRGALIRSQAGSRTRVVVSWDSAYIGQRLRGKVIPFRLRPQERSSDAP